MAQAFLGGRCPHGPAPRSTTLTAEQEAIIVAFRKHTLLPLDDCLDALQATIPQLTRSDLHRCFQRHGISRLPELDGARPAPKKKFKKYPIGYFHIDLTEVRTEEGKLYLFVAVDRTSKFAFAPIVAGPTSRRPRLSFAPWSRPCLTESTPCSPTRASSSPTCPRIAKGPPPCSVAIPSTGPAAVTASNTASPSQPTLDQRPRLSA
jgi:hypothetical protein